MGYNHAKPEHLEAKLYLHGYEVPFIGLRVVSGVNTPSTATIQVIPTKWAKRIRPGTIAHIFYKDHWSSVVTGREIYRLLFEGEVKAKSYQRSEGSKAITLSCMDIASYWVNVRQYYLNFATSNFLSAAQSAFFAGVKSLHSEMLGVEGKLSAFFKDTKSSFTQIIQKILGEISSTNDFYKDASEKFNMDARIFSASSAELTNKVFNHAFFQRFIKHSINTMGGVESLWKTVNMLLNIVHHEMVCLPNPSYIKRDLVVGPLKEQEKGDVYWTNREIRDITLNYKNSKDGLKPSEDYSMAQFIMKPNAWMIEPPSCNMIFPNETLSMAFTNDYSKRMTRFQLIPTNPLIVGSGVTGDNFSRLMAVFQPYEFQQYMREFFNKKTSSKDGRSFEFLTEEEVERGIIPGFSTLLPGAASFLYSQQEFRTKASVGKNIIKTAKRSTVFNENVWGFVHRLSEFEYHRKRAASNSFNWTGVFKPHMVPGFPSVFIDDETTEFDVIALPLQVSWTIYATGQASTDASFVLARELDEYRPSLSYGTKFNDLSQIQTPDEPPLPAWFDAIYNHGKIGMNVYSKVLGCAGLFNSGENTKDDINFASNPFGRIVNNGNGDIRVDNLMNTLFLGEVRAKTLSAVDSMRKKYKASLASGDHGHFAWQSTFRPIITERQLFKDFYKGNLYGKRSYYHDGTIKGDIKLVRVDAKVFSNKDEADLTLIQTSTGKKTLREISRKEAKKAGKLLKNVTDAHTPTKKELAKIESEGRTPSTKKSEVDKAMSKSTQFGMISRATKVLTPNQVAAIEKQAKNRKDDYFVATSEDFFNLAVKTTQGYWYAWGKSGDYFAIDKKSKKKIKVKGFDCSGVVYAACKALKYNIQRHSLYMWAYECLHISVEDAEKIKGAILFEFTASTARKKKPTRHVTISTGVPGKYYEALKQKTKVGFFKRKAKFTHAGLLRKIKYPKIPKLLPTSAIGIYSKLINYNEDLDKHMKNIQKNRIEIIAQYQHELAMLGAFLG